MHENKCQERSTTYSERSNGREKEVIRNGQMKQADTWGRGERGRVWGGGIENEQEKIKKNSWTWTAVIARFGRGWVEVVNS